MLWRKRQKDIIDWIYNEKKALLVTGARQIGKTYLMNDDISLNCGAIYENVVAQELNSHGFKTYYVNSHKQGELDFVIEYKDFVCPIEVKSGKDYTKHSALNNVLNNKDYGIKNAFVFSNFNVEVNGNIIYYPIYFIMFLEEQLFQLPKINKIDLSDL